MTKTAGFAIKHWIKSTSGITILVTVALLAAATIDKGPFLLTNTAVTGGMLAVVSIGLALVFGVMNISQFAHGEYFMIGTLVAYYTFTPVNAYVQESGNELLSVVAPLIAMVLAFIAGLIAGAITELCIFRILRKHSRSNWVMNSFLVTVGVSTILINSHQLLFGTDPKGVIRYWDGSSIEIAGAFVSRDRAASLLISSIIVLCFSLFMKFSRIGKAVRAVSQDEKGASIVGINLNAIQILTMSLSCGLSALGGALLLFIYPSYPTVGVEPLYLSWFVVILAGLGNVVGAVICSFVVALLKVGTVAYLGTGWDFVVPTAIIILILCVKPSGIFGSSIRGVLEE